MKKLLLVFALALCLALLAQAGVEAQAQSDYDGQLVKMEGLSTVYYVIEGKRYVFPSEKAYKSWFTDYDDVVTLSQEEIYALPLAGNVRYRPGVIMLKIQTDPKVYAVGPNGQLRWVKTEQLARKLYGNHWNQLVDDVPDASFQDYTVAEPIDDNEELDVDALVRENDSIEKSRGLQLGQIVRKKAQTVRCDMAESIKNRLESQGKNVPPVLERICRPILDVTNADDEANGDTDICLQKPYQEPGGECDAITEGYYFDGEECQYDYRGCYGVFPFDTIEECENTCEK